MLTASLRVPYLRRLSLSLYLHASNKGKVKRGRRSVCLMFEPRFGRIRKALEERDVNVLIVGRGIFDYLFRVHLGDYIEANTRTFGEYALDSYPRYAKERSRYLKDCTYIAKLLRTHLPASTIILPKYNDDYTLEVVQGFHDAGWTTIVYDREGTVTRKRMEYVAPIVAEQAPTCDYVIAYNKTHKAFFEKVVRLSGIEPPSVIVMGNPASDEWFQKQRPSEPRGREAAGTKRSIVFFAFGEFSYVYDTRYLKGKTEVWRSLLTDIHRVLAEHLTEHPDSELRYKRGPKGNRDYWQGSAALLELPNAHLMSSLANSNALIADSDVVLAFQTTALVDAMHTDKIIIYCAWGPTYESLKGDLIPFEDFAREGALVHATSPTELKRLLALDPSGIKINREARKRIRELYTTNPDGTVASRFADWVVTSVPLNP